jgi:hypothetical protein
VEPGDITRGHLQIQDAHRATLKHLAVMRLLMHGHDGRLSGARRIGRLPRRGLPSDRDTVRQDREYNERKRGICARHAREC